MDPCYNLHVATPIPAREGGEPVILLYSFILSVAASVIAYYICKWLDR